MDFDAKQAQLNLPGRNSEHVKKKTSLFERGGQPLKSIHFITA